MTLCNLGSTRGILNNIMLFFPYLITLTSLFDNKPKLMLSLLRTCFQNVLGSVSVKESSMRSGVKIPLCSFTPNIINPPFVSANAEYVSQKFPGKPPCACLNSNSAFSCEESRLSRYSLNSSIIHILISPRDVPQKSYSFSLESLSFSTCWRRSGWR